MTSPLDPKTPSDEFARCIEKLDEACRQLRGLNDPLRLLRREHHKTIFTIQTSSLLIALVYIVTLIVTVKMVTP